MGKSLCRFFLIAVLFLGTSTAIFAQPDPPGDPPDPVPITGIEILLAVGGALGIKRIIDMRRTKK